jgi:hypothetical protein
VRLLSLLSKNHYVSAVINAQSYVMMMPLRCTRWPCEAPYSMLKAIRKRKLSEMLALDAGYVFSLVQQTQSP